MTETNRLDDDLISVVAHDLKTPISSVKGFIELVGRFGDLNDQQQYYSERAMQGLERMERLVNDLLDLSRLRSSKQLERQRVDLAPLIQDAIQMVQGITLSRSIDIHATLTPDSGWVLGDERMLSLVTSNLLSNAVKYNHDNGDVWIRLRSQGGVVQMDVRDNGRGIPPEDVPRVFDSFFRSTAGDTDPVEGTGLGLAIVKEIIERLDGSISVESVQGEGTTFSVVLPAAQSSKRRLSVVADSAGEASDGIDDSLQDSSEDYDVDSKNENI